MAMLAGLMMRYSRDADMSLHCTVSNATVSGCAYLDRSRRCHTHGAPYGGMAYWHESGTVASVWHTSYILNCRCRYTKQTLHDVRDKYGSIN